MSLHTRLTRRRNSGIYYCRVAVPVLLQSALGKRELWVSLKTSDARQALERVRLASVEIDSILAGARGGSIEPDQTYTSLHNRITSRSHVTFAQLVERFANLPEKQALGHKTKLEYRITFKLFIELLGADTPIHRITRAHCRRVQEVLTQLPPNSAKRLPKLPYPPRMRTLLVKTHPRDGKFPAIFVHFAE